ncbi:hypothetical protein EG68_01786 [Paragonimus skrjabini miyazakii]|uniref:Uncharacterized protein n=1 Tax=Paragonimus skrjabini miyazakii TaxID=59628 RepID=A0A8S9Z6B1_9TREM|nr:hypothetical protein EG68_01786 [Paragonimus skrjabini miyazakii]
MDLLSKMTTLVHLLLLPLGCYAVIPEAAVAAHFQHDGLPTFVKEPPSIVFYMSEYSLHIHHIAEFTAEAVVFPENATVTVAAAYADNPEQHIHLPIIRRSIDKPVQTPHNLRASATYDNNNNTNLGHPYAQLAIRSPSQNSGIRMEADGMTPRDSDRTRLWIATIYNMLSNMVAYMLVSNELGTVRSRPIRPMRMGNCSYILHRTTLLLNVSIFQ